METNCVIYEFSQCKITKFIILRYMETNCVIYEFSLCKIAKFISINKLNVKKLSEKMMAMCI